MAFLEKIIEKTDLTSQIESLNHNTRAGIENTKQQFTNFCKEQGSSFDEAIKEMKTTQNKKDVFKALQSFVNWLTKKGISHSSIPIYFSHLRTILYYHDIPITDQERKKEIKYPKITEDEKHGLTIEEIKQLLESTNLKRKALYLMLLSSGLRIGEAVQLKKKDLELVDSNFMIKVRGETTKTKKGRTCFMSKEATRLVMTLWKKIADEDLIFATNKNPAFAKIAEHVRFNDYRSKVGFMDRYDYSNRFHISLHSFRAFFVTKVSRHDPNLAKRLAGQKSYLEQYDRMDNKEKLELYKKAEPDLFIYEQKPKSQEIQELAKKVEDLEKEKEAQSKKTDRLLQASFELQEKMAEKLLSPQHKKEFYEITRRDIAELREFMAKHPGKKSKND